jgi:hypothetical protein
VATAQATPRAADKDTAERRPVGWLRFLLPPATVLATLGLTLILLLTPFWIHTAIDLSGGGLPGISPAAAHSISDGTVSDLLVGGDFDIALPDGSPAYTADEAGHLRDVRLVLYVFLALAAASAVLVLAVAWRQSHDAAVWRAIGRGGAALVIGLLVLAVVGAVAFGFAFEIFHRVLFPGGNWAFPADSNLIRLYPIAFWQLSATALGVIAGTGGLAAWLIGRRHASSEQGP